MRQLERLSLALGSTLALFVSGLGLVGAATAEPLAPDVYTSLGTLNPVGEVVIDTDALTLSVVGGSTYSGVVQARGNGNPDIAVFTFDGINIPSTVTVSVTGSRPLAILSQGSLQLDGVIDVSGGPGDSSDQSSGLFGNPGGVGVSGGGDGGGGGPSCCGPDPGGDGEGIGGGTGGVFQQNYGAYGGGGAFGGNVGATLAYGNLPTALQAGSGGGGGSAANGSQDNGGGGGAGGGALELGAVGALGITGSIAASGGDGGMADNGGPGGGGSGGGILVHANSVAVSSLGSVDASGGDAGVSTGGSTGAPSPGAGGRISILSSTYSPSSTDLAGLDVTTPGGSAGNGVSELHAINTDIVGNTALSVTGGAIGSVRFSTVTVSVESGSSYTLEATDQTLDALYGEGQVTLTNSSLTLVSSASVSNFSGTMNGNGTLVLNGIYSPGLDAAEVVIDVDVLLETESELTLLLAGTEAGTEYDHLAFGSALTLGGALSVDLADGFTPSEGDTFDLFDASTVTGSFDSVLLPELPVGLFWDTESLESSGILSLTTIPEPSTALLLSGGLLALAAVRWRVLPA